MSKNYSKKRSCTPGEFGAKNKGASHEPLRMLPDSPPAYRDSDPTDSDGFRHLHPNYPDPDGPLEPLSDAVIHSLTKRVVGHMKKLRPGLDLDYWKRVTRQIFSEDGTRVLVNPARAGSGKSTWIHAFLLTLAELYAEGNPLAESLGGVLLVLQKVEDLNAVAQTVNAAIPQTEAPVMIALQSLTRSGKDRQLCRNPDARDFRDCAGCDYASACPLKQSGEQGKRAFLLGATQKRFGDLRKNGTLDGQLLRRLRPDGSVVRRRYLIFDEKPELYQIAALDQHSLNALSDRLEELPARRQISDQRISSLQGDLSYIGVRPFQKLRRESVIWLPEGRYVEALAGFCSLTGEDGHRLETLKMRLEKLLGQNSEELRACMTVLKELYLGKECLFCRTGSFRISCVKDGLACLEDHQVLIFDATAEVDGDYCHNSRLKFLRTPKPPDMRRVTFHLFVHPKLNLSRAAVESKAWLIDGMCALVELLLMQFSGQTFLCVYKKDASRIMASLSKSAKERLAFMEDPDRPGEQTLPYFGGTNGSNAFRTCSNVILLGYTRLSPDVYLERCYAAWKEAGAETQIRNIQETMCHQERPWQMGLRAIPMLTEYENHHLAARLEQEIYRCKLRNPSFSGEVHVFLFCPPKGCWELLQGRFPGHCEVIIETLPDCVAECLEERRSYAGRPTAYLRIKRFLEQWDGQPISVSELRTQAEVSKSAWKELSDNGQLSELLARFGAERTGRGRNTQIRIRSCQVLEQFPA